MGGVLRPEAIAMLVFLLTLLPLTLQTCLPQYDYMVRLYEASQEIESERTKVHSFASNGKPRSKNSLVFWFEEDWKIAVTQVHHAEIHLLSSTDLERKMLQFGYSGVLDQEILVSIYQRRERRGKVKLVASGRFSTDQDLTVPLDNVALFSRPALGKFIVTLHLGGESLPAANFLMEADCATPFLVLKTSEADSKVQTPFLAGDRPWLGDGVPTRRTKRKARNQPLIYRDVTELEKINYHCRRQDLWINFDEIGWEFVITPKDVNIGDCGGQCLSADEHIPHAVVKQLLQDLHPSRNAGILCCQGASYREISALYFKSKQELVIAPMPKIKVKECKCR